MQRCPGLYILAKTRRLTRSWNRAYLLLKDLCFGGSFDTYCVLSECTKSLQAQPLHSHISGPRSESGMGGSSGVGEGYAAMAFSSTGPGQTLSPPSANHRPQLCFDTAAQWRQGHVQQGEGHVSVHHGVRSTGECLVQLHLNRCEQACICSDKLSLFCPSFRWRCCWNSRSLPTTLNRLNGTFQATPLSSLS